jgi:hypothetical protein
MSSFSDPEETTSPASGDNDTETATLASGARTVSRLEAHHRLTRNTPSPTSGDNHKPQNVNAIA